MVFLRVLVQGVCSYLGGSATAEETEVVKKNLDHIDQELGTSGHGLLEDQEVHRLEDDLAVVYYQLGTAVRKLNLLDKVICTNVSRSNYWMVVYNQLIKWEG